MKKAIALLLAVVMLLSLAACGGTSSDTVGPGYPGTWKVDHAMVEGAEFAASELAILDASIAQMTIVIKDKGKAYIYSDESDGTLVDWSETDTGILLDDIELASENGFLLLEFDDEAILYFKKVSDSQLIENNTSTESVTESATTVAPTEETVVATEAEETTTPPASVDYSENITYSIDLTGITTLDELETRIEEHLASSIDSLVSRWEELSAEIDSYDKYVANVERVAGFYQTVISETEQMCIMLYEYSAAYARMILDSDMSADDKYDAADGINDCLYDDACDEINDEIYSGLLEDMLDHFYNGVLSDAAGDENYDEWYDILSDEYDQWYDATSDVYGHYYDAASEIYSFYYDIAGELYGRDYERAEKVYAKFLEKIAKEKNKDTTASNPNAIFDTTLRTANSIDELETVVEAHVTECVQALWTEWEAFTAEIDTFDEYMDNIEAVEAFHAHIEDSASQIFIMICDYGTSYAELILQSGASTKDMYNDFEDFKDCIYEDACEIVKDEIYEDLLMEVKDYYCEGVIYDAKDDVQYSDWSDARSDAYSWWSDSRGEVYSNWSDIRGDLYSFYSDMRSELYSGDLDGANDELQDFREKIEKMRN